MKINYNKVDFKSNLNLPDNLKEINDQINTLCKNLSSLKITFDQNLLEKTINIVQEFEKNKKQFIVFGTGGSSLGARALINILKGNLKKKIDF